MRCRPSEIAATAARAAGLALAAASCVYTGPINRAPDAQITVDTNGPYTIEDEIVVSARKSDDPDGGELEVYWTARHCLPDEGCDAPFIDRRPGRVDEPLTIEPQRRGQLRVILAVYDQPYGAVSVEEHEFDILNRRPEVELQIQGDRLPGGGYLAGDELTAVTSAVDPDDEDADLDIAWDLRPPTGSDPNDLSYDEDEDGKMRIVPDAGGLWEIVASVEDEFGARAEASATFEVVDNSPPCIEATDPAAPGDGAYVLARGDEPARLSVLRVDDELDPYPPRAGDPDAGRTTFRWLVATPGSGGEFVEVSGRDAPDFVVDPAEHAPGDELAIRVEVSDRDDHEIPCGEDALTCSIGANECIQRTTWEVEIR